MHKCPLSAILLNFRRLLRQSTPIQHYGKQEHRRLFSAKINLLNDVCVYRYAIKARLNHCFSDFCQFCNTWISVSPYRYVVVLVRPIRFGTRRLTGYWIPQCLSDSANTDALGLLLQTQWTFRLHCNRPPTTNVNPHNEPAFDYSS